MNIVYNWHVTEKCNFTCKYCFAHWNHQQEIWKDEARVYSMLKAMKNAEHSGPLSIQLPPHTLSTRVNFAGGEPLLLGKSLIGFACKSQEMGMKTSMITNGMLLIKFKEVAKYMDMIGISIDSFCDETNEKIGRLSKSGRTLRKPELKNVIEILKKENSNLRIKFNIVVNKYNYQEKIVSSLLELKPIKIKIFKELPFGSNSNGINEEMFQFFLKNNSTTQTELYIEDNSDMTHSYLMIDPLGRFFQNGNNYDYKYSEPIHKVGFEEALSSIEFNANKYFDRYATGV